MQTSQVFEMDYRIASVVRTIHLHLTTLVKVKPLLIIFDFWRFFAFEFNEISID